MSHNHWKKELAVWQARQDAIAAIPATKLLAEIVYTQVLAPGVYVFLQHAIEHLLGERDGEITCIEYREFCDFAQERMLDPNNMK